ncbi:unnamed protein product [Protopolystoma xenopodis]|uniref:Thyrotropin-releasing hormone receptor n=1 Tax=Protopolystoma xenopodis TaxID=117903 RepID=A0A448XQF4_9PLAT|nr:unnamed protein product [Protopolystoma xenopodis]
MLMMVVLLFALLCLPYRTMVVHNSFFESFVTWWSLLFIKVMSYLNSAVNPILYSAMSHKFRRAFKQYLTFGK